jgi:hypothetical protein
VRHKHHDVYVCHGAFETPSLLLTPASTNIDNLVYVLAGTRAISPFVMATIQYCIYYVCTLLAICFVDKIGRRRALLAGSLVMMTCLMLTGDYVLFPCHVVSGDSQEG